MNKFKQYFLLFSVGCIIIITLGCGADLPIVLDPEKEVPEYIKKTTESKGCEGTAKLPLRMYIDYSAGMHTPINNNFNFIDEIVNITNSNDTEFYSVGFGAPTRIKGNVLDPTHLKNPRQILNYNDPESHLDYAIDSTTAFNGQSIFITDFEQYRAGVLNPSAWATLQFQGWLSKGNRIDIFARPFTNDFGATQHLYVIILTPKCYDIDLVERLSEDKIMNDFGLDWFSFSNDFGQVEVGTYDKKVIYAEREREEKEFGYYDFNFGVIQNQILFNSLKFNNTSQHYSKVKIDYEVTDITESFVKGAKGEDVGNNVFDISINQAQEEYTCNVKLSSNLKGLSRPRELYRIDFYLTDADINFDYAKMDEVLQWRNASTGVLFSSLNKSLQEATRRVKPKKKLLYSYFIELSL